jgi:deoxyribose-phosphate aldolase
MTISSTFAQSGSFTPSLKKKVEWAKNARATRETARSALTCLDLTSLTGSESREDIHELCDIARNNLIHSVCVYPEKVETAKAALLSGNIVIATVVNFPYGHRRTNSEQAATPESVRSDVSAAHRSGARQFDIVLAYDAFQEGRKNYAVSLLKACREAVPPDSTMKVILEIATYDSVPQLRAACKIAVASGADCLKSSTGKHHAGGADLERAAIIMEEAHKSLRTVGVKVSGGIRTLDQCAQYMALSRSIRGWDSIRPDLFRIGGSGVVNALLEKLQSPPELAEPTP